MHNPVKESQDKRDQWENGLEDSNSMTIEYLRARLLSERLVSKAAKERTDELAKRVTELEEQLKIVTLQRKKAERATLNVLSFLKTHGVTDFFEALDSESEEEGSLCESNVDKSNSTVEDEQSGNLKGDDKVELSGSDNESTPSSGRTLSWKSRKETHRSHERKYFAYSIRRLTQFALADSSPRHHLGKSCRQIKPREIRSMVEEPRRESTHSDSPGSDAIDCSECPANCVDTGPEELKQCSEIRDERDLVNVHASDSLQAQRHGHGYEGEMERALEQQAQLIDRYEAQEKAQREWEDKYRESNTSTPDSCEPGNHSDVTEERDETKAAASHAAEIIPCPSNDQKSEEGAAICFSKQPPITYLNSFKLSPDADPECSEIQKLGENHTCRSLAPDFAFPVMNDSQTHENPENYAFHSHGETSSRFNPVLRSPDTSNLAITNTVFEKERPLQSGNCTCKSETLGNRSEQLALTPHEGPQRLEGVLDALQQAKILLKQQIYRSTTDDGSTGKAIEPSSNASIDLDRVRIPIGCDGLFRVPTDFEYEAPSQTSKYSSSLTNYFPFSKTPVNGGGRFLPSHMGPGQSVLTVDRFHSSAVAIATEPRISTRNPWLDFHSDTNIPLSGEFTHSSNRELVPQVSPNEVISGQTASWGVGVPPSDRSLFRNDQIGRGMHRY
ncbi:hypothetical protein Nepgr_001304 [Nepenthes gracilis]|uniref:Uncharacterized protein n=1 Tax=Nepenthes gracilis TaxID=150966 RepID=A0AAD3RXN4_NEPGR|nr:hypothetical protein Nepgr_001304 [Nepenthes gracilis]